MIVLEYIVEHGEIWEEPHRTAINTADLKLFAEQNSALLEDKIILDLACGEGYLSGRKDLGYKHYVGLDNQVNEMASPSIKGNFEMLPFRKESFDVVFSLQKLPQNLGGVKEIIKQGGYFTHQSGKFYYEKQDTEKIISLYFNIIKKDHYHIKISDSYGNPVHDLDNIFVISQKRD